MAVGFFLKNPQAAKSAIVAIVRYNGAMYKRAVGVSCLTKYWNRKTHSVRRAGDYATEAATINARLRSMYDACAAVCMDMTQKFEMMTPAAYWAAVDSRLDRRDTVAIYVSDYIDIYIGRVGGSLSHGAVRSYELLRNNLKKYEEHIRRRLRFEDIDLNFYHGWREYFVRNRLSMSYFGLMVKVLKVVYRAAREVDGLHNCHGTEVRGFSADRPNPKSIYLTQEELGRMAVVEITEEAVRALDPEYVSLSDVRIKNLVADMEVVRNKFMIGAYTGLRISDYNQLRDNNIDDRFIRVTTQKTGASVVIPIHPCVRAILDSGFDVSQHVPDIRFNACIKIVARLAGITDKVEGSKMVGQRVEQGFFPKYELVTSHTARRSAATNMYKAGIPTISIMRITGHTTEASFLRYIRISQEENAELMAKSVFFRS